MKKRRLHWLVCLVMMLGMMIGAAMGVLADTSPSSLMGTTTKVNFSGDEWYITTFFHPTSPVIVKLSPHGSISSPHDVNNEDYCRAISEFTFRTYYVLTTNDGTHMPHLAFICSFGDFMY